MGWASAGLLRAEPHLGPCHPPQLGLGLPRWQPGAPCRWVRGLSAMYPPQPPSYHPGLLGTREGRPVWSASITPSFLCGAETPPDSWAEAGRRGQACSPRTAWTPWRRRTPQKHHPTPTPWRSAQYWLPQSGNTLSPQTGRFYLRKQTAIYDGTCFGACKGFARIADIPPPVWPGNGYIFPKNML